MIIDIPYIKQALGIEIEDEKISYLLAHFFDYICEHINIDTTLEQEEISIQPLNTPILNPTFPNDDLTLFQETLIFAIACNLSTMGISINNISQEIYNEYIPFFDTSKLSLTEDNTQYKITYCDIFDNCLQRLTDYLSTNSNVGYLRRLLDIDPDDVGDSEIEFLIEHYTKYLSDVIPNVDVKSPLFQQAVFLSVACHIFKVNPTAITTPIMYYVDEVRERFQIDFDKFGNTWCDLADAALSDLKKKTYGYYGLRAYDRPGARTKYGVHGPSSRL